MPVPMGTSQMTPGLPRILASNAARYPSFLVALIKARKNALNEASFDLPEAIIRGAGFLEDSSNARTDRP